MRVNSNIKLKSLILLGSLFLVQCTEVSLSDEKSNACLFMASGMSGGIDDPLIRSQEGNQYELALPMANVECSESGIKVSTTSETDGYSEREIAFSSISKIEIGETILMSSEMAGYFVKDDRFMSVFRFDETSKEACLAIGHQAGSEIENSISVRFSDGPWLPFHMKPLESGQLNATQMSPKPFLFDNSGQTFIYLKSRESGLIKSISLSLPVAGRCVN